MGQVSKKKSRETAITPRRAEDFPQWYQNVIKGADLAEMSSVRGCMVIKPWGYGIWERIQRILDDKIKDTGHENVYFPLFIPVSLLEKEARHVKGFAKECAVVTHHRLVEDNGKLIPEGKLEQPLVVRPTSETIIGQSLSKWIQSYRDLPVLINQWVNVVRWEIRPRIFLRTTEFLWQEGHTAHVTKKEALEETSRMLEVYRWFAEEILAIPVIVGEKPPSERFPGAEQTFGIEAMMQDRKALQAGTSHYLGQIFAKSFDIKYLTADGVEEYVYTTSWGVSSRLVGGLVMTHSDDDGLRLPPRVAPKHVVIIPVLNKQEQEGSVMTYVQTLKEKLSVLSYQDRNLQVFVDSRDVSAAEKKWQWVRKGVPIRLEVGPREVESGIVSVFRRDKPVREALSLPEDQLLAQVTGFLDDIQRTYFNEAKAFLETNTRRDIENFEQFTSFFTPENSEKPEIHGGFVAAKWCENPACETKLTDLMVTIRSLPLKQSGTSGKCVICGVPATQDAVFAKAY